MLPTWPPAGVSSRLRPRLPRRNRSIRPRPSRPARPLPLPTATRVPYVTNEPYAYYDFADSFEGISDLAAYGISSSQNTVKVNGANYNTLYQTGHQSLEANGTIAGTSGSSLSMEFDVQKLLGSSTYDFSNKVIVIDVFIPADSPVDWVYFEADSGARMAQVKAFKIKDPNTPSSCRKFEQAIPFPCQKGSGSRRSST